MQVIDEQCDQCELNYTGTRPNTSKISEMIKHMINAINMTT